MVASVAIAVVVVWLLYLARSALLLIYVSILIAAGLSPLVRALEGRPLWPTRHPISRTAAVLLIYAAGFAALLLILAVIVPPLVLQAQELTEQLPSLIDRGREILSRIGLVSRSTEIEDVIQQLPSWPDALGTVLGQFRNIVDGFFTALLATVLSFYLLVESGSLFRGFLRLVPSDQKPQARAVSRKIVERVGSWMIGQLILCGIIGATTAIGLGLIGVPYFYVLSVVAALGEFVPYAGPMAAAIPAILIGSSVSWQTAAAVVAFYLAQQQLENNVIVPKLMQHQLGLSAAVVIIAITLGLVLLGTMGAILAVPTAAILRVALHELHPDGAEGGGS